MIFWFFFCVRHALFHRTAGKNKRKAINIFWLIIFTWFTKDESQSKQTESLSYKKITIYSNYVIFSWNDSLRLEDPCFQFMWRMSPKMFRVGNIIRGKKPQTHTQEKTHKRKRSERSKLEDQFDKAGTLGYCQMATWVQGALLLIV